MKKLKSPPGRIAFREEGEFWNVYFASRENMDGALHLASIRMNLVIGSDRRERFMEIIKDAMAEFFQDHGVEVDNWNEQIPPEKMGHG